MTNGEFMDNWELKYNVGDCKLMPHDGRWKRVTVIDEETGRRGWEHISIVDVPVRCLVYEWEQLVIELSEKEFELLKQKEYIAMKSFELEQTVDFKELYGKNNADSRKHHIKGELADVFDEVTALELGINWIRSYIPLLKEVIRSKQC